jgi:hypothetical protein
MFLRMLGYVYWLHESFFMLIFYPKDPPAICTQPDDGVRRQAQGRFFLCLVTTPPSHLRGEDVAYQGRYRRGCCFAPLRLSTMPGILFHAENSRGRSGELPSFQNVSLPKIMTSFARNASSCTICKSVRLRQLLQSSRRGRMRSWLPRLVP